MYNTFDQKHEITSPAPIEPKSIQEDHKKVDDIYASLAGVAGNILEWYDFAIFGYFGDIIGKTFFPPNQGGHAALIEAFTVFGMAFLVRPVGGALIGKMGDMHGRKGALETSIFYMAIPTFLLGCLPTYAMVGWLSTALLISVRLLQGLSVGGQFTSALVFTLERTHKSNWGFWAAAVYAASDAGVTLGSLIASMIRDTLTEEQVESWGWRIPFWLGALGALPAIYLRYRTEEIEVPSVDEENEGKIYGVDEMERFTGKKDAMKSKTKGVEDPLVETLSKSNRRAFLASILVTSLVALCYYIIFLWLVLFMQTFIDPPIPHAFTINSVNGFLGGIFLVMFGGWFADKVGDYVKISAISAISLGILFPVALAFLGSGWDDSQISVTMVAFCIQFILSFFLAMLTGAMLPWLVLIFPPQIRLTSVSLGYNIAVCAWGGFSPLVATILVNKFHANSAPGYLVTFASFLALVGLWIAPKTNKS